MERRLPGDNWNIDLKQVCNLVIFVWPILFIQLEELLWAAYHFACMSLKKHHQPVFQNLIRSPFQPPYRWLICKIIYKREEKRMSFKNVFDTKLPGEPDDWFFCDYYDFQSDRDQVLCKEIKQCTWQPSLFWRPLSFLLYYRNPQASGGLPLQETVTERTTRGCNRLWYI